MVDADATVAQDHPNTVAARSDQVLLPQLSAILPLVVARIAKGQRNTAQPTDPYVDHPTSVAWLFAELVQFELDWTRWDFGHKGMDARYRQMLARMRLADRSDRSNQAWSAAGSEIKTLVEQLRAMEPDRRTSLLVCALPASAALPAWRTAADDEWQRRLQQQTAQAERAALFTKQRRRLCAQVCTRATAKWFLGAAVGSATVDKWWQRVDATQPPHRCAECVADLNARLACVAAWCAGQQLRGSSGAAHAVANDLDRLCHAALADTLQQHGHGDHHDPGVAAADAELEYRAAAELTGFAASWVDVHWLSVWLSTSLKERAPLDEKRLHACMVAMHKGAAAVSAGQPETKQAAVASLADLADCYADACTQAVASLRTQLAPRIPAAAHPESSDQKHKKRAPSPPPHEPAPSSLAPSLADSTNKKRKRAPTPSPKDKRPRTEGKIGGMRELLHLLAKDQPPPRRPNSRPPPGSVDQDGEPHEYTVVHDWPAANASWKQAVDYLSKRARANQWVARKQIERALYPDDDDRGVAFRMHVRVESLRKAGRPLTTVATESAALAQAGPALLFRRQSNRKRPAVFVMYKSA